MQVRVSLSPRSRLAAPACQHVHHIMQTSWPACTVPTAWRRLSGGHDQRTRRQSWARARIPALHPLATGRSADTLAALHGPCGQRAACRTLVIICTMDARTERRLYLMARVLPGTAPHVVARGQADVRPALAWIEAHADAFRG